MRRIYLFISGMLLMAGAVAPALPAEETGTAVLPITRVVLFRSGVGYIERSGKVNGNESLTLQFKTDQINDLLKSLVLQDFDGGQILPVTYAPKDPIARTLQSFAIDISDNPSLWELLNRLRGVEVRITVPTQTVTGRVLGVEQHPSYDDNGKVRTTAYQLNLATATGITAVPLAQVQSFQIQDAALRSEFQKAMETLASGLDSSRKTVRLDFAGKGERRVRIAYITAMPVWKMSYRLVLDDEKKPFLQGWAIVENTSADDWNQVDLSLVSGRPISFIQDLYQPLYLPRPEIQTPLYESLRPQTYAGSLQEERQLERAKGTDRDGSLRRGAMGPSGAMGPAGPPGPSGGYGGGGFSSNRLASTAPRKQTALDLASSGVASMASAEDLGALFEYHIDQPVTLVRQQSALLPIVNQEVDGWQVSVYNAAVQPRFPLYGLRLKNTTDKALLGGPITVYAKDTYGGDALIEDIEPGGIRLLTYAVDQRVEVATEDVSSGATVLSLKIVRGVLTETRKLRRTKVYTVKNRDTKDRVLLIEHPVDSEWTLAEPKEPDEKTATVYRFRVEVPAGKSVKLPVVEEHQEDQTVQLLTGTPETLGIYLQNPKLTDAVKAALDETISRQKALAGLQSQMSQLQNRISEINSDQSRIRQNMAQLDRNSALYQKYVTRLGDQEDELDKLRVQVKDLQTEIDKQRASLADYLTNLNVE